MTNVKTAIIILAAGNSSRLGGDKQLLIFKGKTLLQHVMVEAGSVDDTRIFVVTGSRAETIEKSVADFSAVLVRNTDWEHGMGSSIKKGLIRALELEPFLDQIILAVCDQPFVDTSIFQNLLIQAAMSTRQIVASTYFEAIGTPVLFKKNTSPICSNSPMLLVQKRSRRRICPIPYPSRSRKAISISTPKAITKNSSSTHDQR